MRVNILISNKVPFFQLWLFKVHQCPQQSAFYTFLNTSLSEQDNDELEPCSNHEKERGIQASAVEIHTNHSEQLSSAY